MKTFALILSGLIVGIVVWHIIYTNSKKEDDETTPPPSGSGPRPRMVSLIPGVTTIPTSTVNSTSKMGLIIPTENINEYYRSVDILVKKDKSVYRDTGVPCNAASPGDVPKNGTIHINGWGAKSCMKVSS